MPKHENGILKLTTWDLIKRPFVKENPFSKKNPISGNGAPPPPPSENINHLAVILDGEVQEILRAENRLAALFLSQPEFIEFDPDSDNVAKLNSRYIDGKFIEPESPEASL